VGTGRGVAVGDGAGRAVAVGVGVCATADEECFAYANPAPAAAASPMSTMVNTMARSFIGIPAFTKRPRQTASCRKRSIATAIGRSLAVLPADPLEEKETLLLACGLTR
jgi:hypothetical protein